MKRTTTKTTRKTNKARRMVALLVAAALCVTLVAGFAASGFAAEEPGAGAPAGESGAGNDPSADPQGGPAQDDDGGGAAGTPGPAGDPHIQGGGEGAGQDDTGGGALDGNGGGAAVTPGATGDPLTQEGAEPELIFAEVSRVGYPDPAADKFYTDTEDNAPLKIAVDFAVAEGEGKIAPLTVQVQNQGENYFKLPEVNPESVCSVPAEVKSVPRVDGAGQPVLAGNGEQINDIEVTFTPEGSGRAELAIPYDQGKEPGEGTKLAQVWAGGVPFEVTSGLLEAPIRAQADEPVEITKLTSTNNPYTTNQTNNNKLVVTGSYKVNDTAGAAGTTITVVLKNDTTNPYTNGAPYFTEPSPSDISLPTAATNLQISTAGSDVTISFDLASGNVNDTANFTINLPFNHADCDGWAANAAHLADVTATAAKNEASSQKTLAIQAAAASLPYFGTIAKIPAGDVPADAPSTLRWAFYSGSVKYWRFEPGTSVKIVMEYPAGAVVKGYSGTDDGAGNVVLVTGTADADGVIRTGVSEFNATTGGWNRYNYNSTITFPSKDVDPVNGFEVGETVQVNWYAEFQKVGDPTVRRVDSAALTFKIAEPEVHMKENAFAVTGEAIVFIGSPETASRVTENYTGIANAGTAPIPKTCITWYNDSDGAGKPANLCTIRWDVTGTTCKTKLVFHITDGAGGARQVTKYINPNTNWNVNTNVPLGAGEYIEKMEIWPLDNPDATAAELQSGAKQEVLALPYGTTASCLLSFKSWPGGAFPNGTPIQAEDTSAHKATLSWQKESYPATHTAATTDGTTWTQTLENMGKAQKVFYNGKLVPNPLVSYALGENQGGDLPPGAPVGMKLYFRNASNTINGSTLASANWVDPVILMLLPDVLEFDPDQALNVYNGATLVGQAAATKVTAADGRTMYRLEMPAMSLAPSNNSTYYVDAAFTVKAGAPAGTGYRLASDSGWFGKAGLLFGTSRVPNDLQYPLAGFGSHYPDTYDYDGNPDTTYLLRPGAGAAFNIALSKDLSVSAKVLNNTAEGGPVWQMVDTAGAQSTVALGGTGEFEFQLKNQGNTYLGDIRLLDILPQAGDTTVLDAAARGSQWNAALQSMTVTVYDAENTDVTGDFPYTLRYSTQGDPNYNTGGITRAGSGTFTTGASVSAAKSFDFALDGNKRLPPGYRIVFHGVVQAPASATAAQVGQAAYNSFAVAAAYYTNAATSNTVGKEAIGAFEPTRQKFVLADSGTAQLTKNGRVFQDIDGDGKYMAGTDQPYAGVTVELYRDEGGSPAASYSRQTTTDPAGQYAFSNLGGGDYYVKVILPTHATVTNAYSFTTRGADGAAADSHVDAASGLSSKFTVNPGATRTADVNAGIIANAKLTVEFREGSATGTLKKTATDTAMGLALSPLPKSGTVTIGTTAGLTLPANYKLKTGQAAAQNWALTWDDPQQTLVYVVELDNYTVTFDKNTTDTVTGMPTAQTVLKGGNVTPPGANPVRAGWTFGGWYREPGEAQATQWVFDTDTVQGATTLYAKWTPAANTAYRVEHYQQDLGAATYTIVAADTENLAGTTAATAAYTAKSYAGFINNSAKTTWQDSANAAGATARTIAADGSLVIRLYYDRQSYNVSYAYTGTAPAGAPTAPAAASKQFGASVTVAAAPTMTGYTFGGWSTADATIGAGAFTMPAGPVALTGQWFPNGNTAYKVEHYRQDLGASTYTIVAADTQNLSGTTDAAAAHAANSYEGFTYAAAKTTWQTGTNAASTTARAIAPDGSLVIRLYYDRNAHNVTYAYTGTAPAGAPAAPAAASEEFGANVTVAAAPALAGYAFGGWTTGDAAVSAGAFTMPDGAVAFTGQWYQIFTVNFYTNNVGTELHESATVTEPDTLVKAADWPENPAKTHYAFGGWFTQPNGGGAAFDQNSPVTAASTGMGADGVLNVYAKWTGDTYTVTFDKNGGDSEASPKTMSVTYPTDKLGGLPQPPAKTGYVFDGWNTKANGGGAAFDGQTVVTGDITVYAQWAPSYYKLMFDLNGVAGSTPGNQVLKYQELAAKVDDPARAGYTFAGWNTKADGSGAMWNFATDKMPAADVTLYAQWKAAPVVTPEEPTPTPTATPTPRATPTPTATPAVSPEASAPPETAEETSDTQVDPQATPDPGPRASRTIVIPGITTGDGGDNGTDINGGGVPLFGDGVTPVWALLNLILACAGAVAAVALLAAGISEKRKKEEKDPFLYEDEEEKKTRPAWLAVTVLLGIAGVAAFLLTENMNNLMVWMDQWTPLMAVLAGVEAVAAAISSKKKKKDGEADGIRGAKQV